MANLKTVQNSLEKMENKLAEEDKYPFCGVILQEDYDKLVFPDEQEEGNKRRVGYLVIPGRKPEEEWGG